ncbi:hypothetical protein M422DRAFT_38904, partial [Sphaerobolus stellatus SS14]
MVDYYVPLYPLLRSTTSSRMSTVIDHHAPLLIPPVAVDHIVRTACLSCPTITSHYIPPLRSTTSSRTPCVAASRASSYLHSHFPSSATL